MSDIGTVENVVQATADTDAYLVVSRGVFKGNAYILADAVVNRAGKDIFINVPKLVVGEMPWEEPPARQIQKEKEGPKASDVGKLYGSRAPTAMETPVR